MNAVDRKSTRLNSSHLVISYAVFCLKKKKKKTENIASNERRTRRRNIPRLRHAYARLYRSARRMLRAQLFGCQRLFFFFFFFKWRAAHRFPPFPPPRPFPS